MGTLAEFFTPGGDRMVLGQYTQRHSCRFCESKQLERVLDFGLVPLAGGFLKPDQFAEEKFYPLQLDFCRECSLVQVSNVVDAKDLFKNYFYFSSSIKTLVTHCTDFAQEMVERFHVKKVFEIGCNDGVMLKPLAQLGVQAVGMDPAVNVVASIKEKDFMVINDFFNEKTAEELLSSQGSFDAVLSSYSFAHIDQMISVMKGIKKILKGDGVFAFEVYYLGTLLDETQYDMIYHEHLSYYSLKALESFLGSYEMQIFDVKYTPGVRSGAVRFYACHQKHPSLKPTAAVAAMRKKEEQGYTDIKTFVAFGQKVRQSKQQLIELLEDLKRKGKSIIGYGASGRGTMIMNYCGINGKYLDYVVDDAPAKHGFYTPGQHVPIVAWSDEKYPDYALLFAWSFINEVKARRASYLQSGGKFIVPLPQVKAVGL